MALMTGGERGSVPRHLLQLPDARRPLQTRHPRRSPQTPRVPARTRGGGRVVRGQPARYDVVHSTPRNSPDHLPEAHLALTPLPGSTYVPQPRGPACVGDAGRGASSARPESRARRGWTAPSAAAGMHGSSPRRIGQAGRLIGLDQDPTMLELARSRLAGLPVELVHANFDQLPEVIAKPGDDGGGRRVRRPRIRLRSDG